MPLPPPLLYVSAEREITVALLLTLLEQGQKSRGVSKVCLLASPTWASWQATLP